MAKKLSVIFQGNNKVSIIDGGVVPENFTGTIRKKDPTHLILIDAVEMSEFPGYIRIIGTDEIANYNISTHAMPLSFLIKYLQSTIESDMKIILIGIQPKEMNMVADISKEVKNSIEKLMELFKTQLDF
ncbi:hydrogenase maturation peptidase HycI [Methanobacterium alcaliphilum]|nr:hydrogenase maturation peptidase HycI [Methanobacterium alcaliphilum]